MERHLILFKDFEAYGFPFTHFCNSVYDLNVIIDLLIIAFIFETLIFAWKNAKRENRHDKLPKSNSTTWHKTP